MSNQGCLTDQLPLTINQWVIESLTDDVVVIRETNAPEPQPSNWKELFVDFLSTCGSVAVVGAKRLVADGSVILSMGEMVIHPKGLHQIGKGLPAYACRFPEEVDCVMGGIFAVKRQYLDTLPLEQFLNSPLGGMQLCLAIRLMGGRSFVIPQVVLQYEQFQQPTRDDILHFYKLFGFDWVSPDLEEIKQRYKGRDLLWNMKFFANAMPFEKYEQRGAMHWTSYEEHPMFHKRADDLIHTVTEQIGENSADKTVVDLGCGDGLYSHLIAQQGYTVIGIDAEDEGVKQSQEMCAKQEYPGKQPEFMQGMAENIQLKDQSVDFVLMFDVIEHLPNPIRVLTEIGRILKSGGKLMITTPEWQYGRSSDPVYHNFEYTRDDLTQQLNCIAGMRCTQIGSYGNGYRDLVAISEKL